MNRQSAKPQPDPNPDEINLPTSLFGFPKFLTQANYSCIH